MPDVEGQFDKVRAIFQKWDEDGGGTIEKEELGHVLLMLSPMWGDTEVNQLMAQIDTSGDGHIDYAEFLAWICDPKATFTLHKDGWFGNFDFTSCVKPLFEVFDKDDSGFISFQELRECLAILHSSLSLHPCSKGTGVHLAECFEEEFASMDSDGDERVTFAEFVKWQVKVIQKAGVPNSIAHELVDELAMALKVIFDIDALTQSGAEVSGGLQALQDRIQEVASKTRVLYSRDSIAQSHVGDVEKSLWEKPIPGDAAMSRLFRTVATELGINLTTGTAQKGKQRRQSRQALNGQVQYCIPDNHQHPANQWLAQVARTTHDGKEELFIYATPSSQLPNAEWQQLDHGLAVFTASLHMLPAALQLFAHLRCQMFGQKFSFSSAESALKTAPSLLSEDLQSRFGNYVRACVKTSISESTLQELQQLGQKAVDEEVAAQLSKVEITPRSIILMLWELGMPVPDTVWKQLDDSTD